MSLGKYVLRRKIGRGAFSVVWKAFDSVEGINVALKIPDSHALTEDGLKEFKKEARLAATLNHPNILRIKNADFIKGQFVIVYDLGHESLHEALEKPMSLKKVLNIGQQVLEAMAFAHQRGVIHRDVKPENIIVFPDKSVKLADFGISRLATRTIMTESPMGTLGYMAPEQAYGKANFSSDTFAIGILFYEMLTNHLPDWPFQWPFKQHDKLVKRGGEEIARLVQKATEFEQKRRFQNGTEMLQAFSKACQAVEKKAHHRKIAGRAKKPRNKSKKSLADRTETFVRRHGRTLELGFHCAHCHKPVAESMIFCPWCGYDKNDFSRATDFPFACGACGRGVYGDWSYCPWCYTSKFRLIEEVSSADPRYTGKCANLRCGRQLMPFMHYCPWCQRKRRKPWRLKGLPEGCPKCHWSVSRADWNYCPWCGLWPLV